MYKFSCITKEKLDSFFEDLILYSRYILYFLYLSSLGGIFLIIVDFFKLFTGEDGETTNHILLILEILDITMIANLIWLISAGSYYVFIAPFPSKSEKKRPRSLAHISTGLLKEKMAGSLIGVSSVHLLQTFLHVSESNEKFSFNDFGKIMVLIIIHLMFIVGLLAFNYANKADHQGHNQEKGKEEDGQQH